MPGLRRVNGVSERVRRFVAQQGCGNLFTTRDLLGFGKRGAVDQATRRLVNSGCLQRIARGVFCKTDGSQHYVFDTIEVAFVKANAFAKDTVKVPLKFAEGNSILFERRRIHITGRASSFQHDAQRVHCTDSAPRKVGLGSGPAADLLRHYWRSGKESWKPAGDTLVSALAKVLSEQQIAHLTGKYRQLPAWLNDHLVVHRYCSAAA